MFTGFSSELVVLGDASIYVRYAGNGPPILLLHGHPRTHATCIELRSAWLPSTPLCAQT